jgi:hypothetical protein
MKAYGGSGSINPHFLGGERSASASASAYPQGKNPWYPLDRRLGGPQSWSQKVEKRKFLTLLGLEL